MLSRNFCAAWFLYEFKTQTLSTQIFTKAPEFRTISVLVSHLNHFYLFSGPKVSLSWSESENSEVKWWAVEHFTAWKENNVCNQ